MILSAGTPATRATTFSPLSPLAPATRLHTHKQHLISPILTRLSFTFSLSLLSVSLFISFPPTPETSSAEGPPFRRSPFQPPRPECRLIGRLWRRPFTGVLEHSAGPSQASGYGLQGAGMSAYAPHLGARAFSATTGKCFVGGRKKKSHNTRQLVGAISNLKPHDL